MAINRPPMASVLAVRKSLRLKKLISVILKIPQPCNIKSYQEFPFKKVVRVIGNIFLREDTLKTGDKYLEGVATGSNLPRNGHSGFKRELWIIMPC